MRGRRHERIEALVDRCAAAVLAAAVGSSTFALLNGFAFYSRSSVAALAAAAAFLVGSRPLRSVTPERARFDLPTFDVPPIVAQPDELLLTEQVELILTDADRLTPAPAPDELVLDDILAKLGPQSRVVRLFDPAAMPTPGQLNARIEWHLQGGVPASPEPQRADASDALLQALSELRRSLR